MSDTAKKSVAKAAGVVALGVFGSRVLGLIRDLVFSAFFGAGAMTDAFFTAFRIPNLLRDLFAEGALSSAFVPVFTTEHEQTGLDKAFRLANTVINTLILLVGSIVLLGIVFAPVVVSIIAPGFADEPGKVSATVSMTRIMFPFLLTIALAAVVMGMLNTFHRFLVPSSASCWFNAGSIFVGLAVGYWIDPSWGPNAIYGWAIGTMAGGVLQLLWQLPSLWKIGYRWQPVVDFRSPAFRHIVTLMCPAVIGTSAVQVNLFVNTIFASMLGNGPVSWLYYAFRLMQLPIGLFGVALGVATLPAISRYAARNDTDGFRDQVADSVRLAFLLCVPAAVLLVVLGVPVIALLFERGEFTATDTAMTAQALAWYTVGLAGYAGIKILTPAFYALGQPRFPMFVSLISIVVNLGANWFLVVVWGWGHQGLALTTSLVALSNFGWLWLGLRTRLTHMHTRSVLKTLWRTLVAAGCMAVIAYMVQQLGTEWWGDTGSVARLLNVFLPTLLSSPIYLILILFQGELGVLKALRRKPR